jgi:sec-independent protein translocase protein TatA
MGIGTGEIILILIIALLLFGPDKLPELGKILGKTVREIRKYSQIDISQIEDIKDKEEKTKPLSDELTPSKDTEEAQENKKNNI